MRQLAMIILAGVLISLLAGSVDAQEPEQGSPGMGIEQEQAAPGAQEIDVITAIELMRTNLKVQKKQLLIQSMRLNEEQARIFWPIYDEYDHELDRLNDKMLGIIMDYSKTHQNMTDKIAHDLMTRSLDNQTKKLVLKKAYAKKIEKFMSSKIAARFVQADGVLNKLIELQIDARLPLIQID
jgi:hypothetical protein